MITAGLDKCIKVWHTPQSDLSDATLMYKVKVNQLLTTLKYSTKNQAVAFMDSECSLGIIPLNLANFGKPAAQQQDDSGDDDDALLNEIDMEDIKEAIGEEEQNE